MNKIINPKSSYFNQNCRIIKKLEDHKLEVLLEEDEILIVVSCEDVDLKKNVCKPKSRKEFYCHIKDPMTTRNDIKSTISSLVESGGIVTNDLEKVLSLFSDMDKDPEVLVEEFRAMRDEGVFEFNLPNAIYTEKKYSYRPKSVRMAK